MHNFGGISGQPWRGSGRASAPRPAVASAVLLRGVCGRYATVPRCALCGASPCPVRCVPGCGWAVTPSDRLRGCVGFCGGCGGAFLIQWYLRPPCTACRGLWRVWWGCERVMVRGQPCTTSGSVCRSCALCEPLGGRERVRCPPALPASLPAFLGALWGCGCILSARVMLCPPSATQRILCPSAAGAGCRWLCLCSDPLGLCSSAGG